MLPNKCTIHASFKSYDLFFLFLQVEHIKNEFHNNYTTNPKSLNTIALKKQYVLLS